MKMPGLALVAVLTLMAASIAAEPNARPSDVLLLPLSPVNQADAWIGQAVQQNLLNELGRTPLVSPVTPTTQPVQPVADSIQALKAGEAAKTAYVVFGSYQINEGALRLTAQVLDTQTARIVGSAKATGSMRDLFALEDELAGQVRSVLASLRPPVEARKPFTPVVPLAVAQAAGGLQEGARIAGPLLDNRQAVNAPDWRPPMRDFLVNSNNYYYSYYSPRTYLLSPYVYNCVPTRRFQCSTGFGFSGAYYGNKGFVQFRGGACR